MKERGIELPDWYSKEFNLSWPKDLESQGERFVCSYDVPALLWGIASIYRLYLGRQLVYVGRTTTGLHRVMEQYLSFRADRAVVLAFPEILHDDLAHLENLFIGALNPSQNRAKVLEVKGWGCAECKSALRGQFVRFQGCYFRYTVSGNDRLHLRILGPRFTEGAFEKALERTRESLDAMYEATKDLDKEIVKLKRRRGALRKEVKEYEHLLTEVGYRRRLWELKEELEKQALREAPIYWFTDLAG